MCDLTARGSVPQFAVHSAGNIQQLRMRATLHHLAPVEDEDQVSVPDGGEPVGNSDGSAALLGLLQGLLHHLLALRVQGRGGLVQQQDGRVPAQWRVCKTI